jgi:tRNA uridine 5-carbamoylmethylation protein Kti12
MVYVEAPYERLFVQNKNRTARVPEAVIHRLIDRWEVPDVLEAHRVDPVLQEGD